MAVFEFDDPVTRTMRYLNRFYPGQVVREEPDYEDYDKDALLILVRDGGGSGEYAHQLQDVRLTFEVRSGSQREAAQVANRVDALVRDWTFREGGVYYRGGFSRPLYQPEPERRIPAYVWTVNLAFRGHPLTI